VQPRATIIFVILTPERCRKVQSIGNNNICKLNSREMKRSAAQGQQKYLQTQLQRHVEKCSPKETIIFANPTPERCREMQPEGNNNICKLNSREMQRIAAQGQQ
jgi:hypothetical protein